MCICHFWNYLSFCCDLNFELTLKTRTRENKQVENCLKQSKNSNTFFWWKKSLGNERREFQDSNELSLWELKILRCFISFYVSFGDQTLLKLVISKLLERSWKMFYWSEVLFSKQRHTMQVIANWRIKNHSAKTIPNQLIFMQKCHFSKNEHSNVILVWDYTIYYKENINDSF